MQRKAVIERIRRMKGKGTQAALAAKLGITPGHLSEILSGKKNPGKQTVKNLAGIKAEKETVYHEVKR